MAIVDVFAHILPPKFKEQMLKIAPNALDHNQWMKNSMLSNIEKRIASIEPEHQEILSIENLNPEDFTNQNRSFDLCNQANDELAKIVQSNSSIFPKGVAMVPMNNIEGAIKIIDAISNSKTFAGIQIFTQNITALEYEVIFAEMNKIKKPIWLHPIFDSTKTDNNVTFSWEYELTLAMNDIIKKKYFQKYPDLKIIVHHAGAMIPYFAERIRHIQGEENYYEFKKFFVDTALLGNSKALELTVDFFGIDHVLFGTDTPLGILPAGPTKTIETALHQTNLSNENLNKIFYQNWENLKEKNND